MTAPVSRSAVESAAVSVPHAAAAVEATLDAMERTRDAAHQSVELKLTFGDDTPLAVRVELHEGIVRTTFRTDSPELRQALASEWRQTAPSVLATATDRTVRVADPVFGPSADSPDLAGASTGGHANSRQATPSFSPESSFSPASSTRPRIGSQASSAPAIPSRLPTSLRLNAFA